MWISQERLFHLTIANLQYVCRLLPLKRHVLFLYDINRIDVVMVNVLASSAVDRGFKYRPCRTKDYQLCCFSAKYTALRRKSKVGRLEIGIMYPSWATYLCTDCSFSELALYKSN